MRFLKGLRNTESRDRAELTSRLRQRLIRQRGIPTKWKGRKGRKAADGGRIVWLPDGYPVSFSVSFKKLLPKSPSYRLMAVLLLFFPPGFCSIYKSSSKSNISIQATFSVFRLFVFLREWVLDIAHHDSSFGPELAHRASSSGAGEAKAHTGCQAGPPGEGTRRTWDLRHRWLMSLGNGHSLSLHNIHLTLTKHDHWSHIKLISVINKGKQFWTAVGTKRLWLSQRLGSSLSFWSFKIRLCYEKRQNKIIRMENIKIIYYLPSEHS